MSIKADALRCEATVAGYGRVKAGTPCQMGVYRDGRCYHHSVRAEDQRLRSSKHWRNKVLDLERRLEVLERWTRRKDRG